MASLPSKVPNVLGDTGLDRFDAVVIGSGAGGSAAIRVLATNGLKVCVLEAGNNYWLGLDDPKDGMPVSLFSSDEVKMTSRELIKQQTRIEPRTFRSSPADGDRTFVGDVNDPIVPSSPGLQALYRDAVPALNAFAVSRGAADFASLDDDGKLAAFDADVPAIYRGGPFSGRTPYPDPATGDPSGDYPHDAFLEILPPTRMQELSFRIELFGSASVPNGDVNDPIVPSSPGLQALYRDAMLR